MKLRDLFKTAAGASAEARYTCPMHPEIAQDKPGKCPKCGMNLVKEAGKSKTEEKSGGCC
jgi:hypothetical protein